MSLIEEFEKIIAQEQARRTEADSLNGTSDQPEHGLLASLAASLRELRALVDRRPRG